MRRLLPVLSWESPPASKLVSLESTNTSTVYQLYTESLSSPNPFSEKGFLVV